MIYYRLLRVTQLEYSVQTNMDVTDGGMVDLGLALGYQREQSQVFLDVAASYRSKDTNHRFLQFKARFLYALQDFNSVITIDNGLTADSNFLVQIIQTSIDTSRGILIARNAGTPLADIYIPVIQAEDLLQHLRLIPEQTADSDAK